MPHETVGIEDIEGTGRFQAEAAPSLLQAPNHEIDRENRNEGNRLKWFKHYANAHKGGVLQQLYLDFGVNEGHGLYFRLIEYLADKWDGSSEPKFKILTSELRRYLTLTTPKLRQLAVAIQSSGESEFKVEKDFCEIFLPKLLEVRHRDAISSRERPETGRTRSSREKNKNNKKKKNIEDWQKESFETLSNKFKELFPGTVIGAGAETRFYSQIKNLDDVQKLSDSMDHYRLVLDASSWRASKTSFANYLGTEKSGFFWRAYIEKPSLPSKLNDGVYSGFAKVPA